MKQIEVINYNKLVRDKIPEIIEKDNSTPVIRVLEEPEYKSKLFDKLIEEANEVVKSKSSDEILEECADILEVLESIIDLENSSFEEVFKIKEIKKAKRGGFEKRIFLEKEIKNN